MQDTDRLFWELIETHWESLWRFSLGLTTDWDEAKDLMSETVLAAQKSFESACVDAVPIQRQNRSAYKRRCVHSLYFSYRLSS
jgi:DNA-directed RNA polymerase specialized sigma24 family protein